MQITFNTEDPSDVAFVKKLLGMAPAPTPAPPFAPAFVQAPTPSPAVGLPVPSWAAAGSRWVATPGAPMLEGPAGEVIPVLWDGATPKPGTLTVNHDATAEALGQLVLDETRNQ